MAVHQEQTGRAPYFCLDARFDISPSLPPNLYHIFILHHYHVCFSLHHFILFYVFFSFFVYFIYYMSSLWTFTYILKYYLLSLLSFPHVCSYPRRLFFNDHWAQFRLNQSNLMRSSREGSRREFSAICSLYISFSCRLEVWHFQCWTLSHVPVASYLLAVTFMVQGAPWLDHRIRSEV
jgi:hypothetical protein